MPEELPPSEIVVNNDLEDARPLSFEEFKNIKQEEVSLGELSQEKTEFYGEVQELAQNIKSEGVYHSVLTRKLPDGTIELITGYRRYLACCYIGRPVPHKVSWKSDSEVIKMIYNENENRHDLDPYDRAVVMAKAMGRWDEERRKYISPKEAPEEGMNLVEFADNSGKDRAVIYSQLSPIRQSRKVRDEFSDELTESSMELIEQITTKESEEYTLAQALYNSSVDTFSKFQSIYKAAKKENPEDMVTRLCKSLIGFKPKDVEGSWVDPEEQVSDTTKSIIKNDKEKLQKQNQKHKEKKKKLESEVGEDVPSPTAGPNSDVKIDNSEDSTPIPGSTSQSPSPDSGVGVIPSEKDQPASEEELEVTISEGEVSQLVREETYDNDRDPSEFIENVLKIHFRKEGLLRDTPEALASD